MPAWTNKGGKTNYIPKGTCKYRVVKESVFPQVQPDQYFCSRSARPCGNVAECEEWNKHYPKYCVGYDQPPKGKKIGSENEALSYLLDHAAKLMEQEAVKAGAVGPATKWTTHPPADEKPQDVNVNININLSTDCKELKQMFWDAARAFSRYAGK